MEDVLAYIDKNRARFVAELAEWVKIPAISSDPAHAADMRQERRAPHGTLRALGAGKVEMWPTQGPPRGLRRVACTRRASPRSSSTATTTCSRSTRSSEWISPPFEPHDPRRADVGARRRRRQRPGLHPRRRRSRASSRRDEEAADQLEAHRRGRRGDRQRRTSTPDAREREGPRRGLRVRERHGDVRARDPVALRRPARPHVPRGARRRAEVRICTPARSAAASPTR